MKSLKAWSIALVIAGGLMLSCFTINAYALNGYQDWVGLPSSPGLTTSYPNQVILQGWGQTWLLMGKGPIYYDATDSNMKCPATMEIYKLNSGVWNFQVIQSSLGTFTQDMIKQANNPVYSDSTFTTVLLAKTTFIPFEIISPVNNETVNNERLTVKCTAKIAHTIAWGVNGNAIAENINAVSVKIKNDLDVTINNMPITPTDVLISWKSQDNQYYNLEIDIVLPITISGANTIKVGTNFITQFGSLFSDDKVVRYDSTVSINVTLPIDTNNDGIDDNTGNPVLSTGDKPQRADYVSGIDGDINYYWDMLVYYIKMPFTLVRGAFGFLRIQFSGISQDMKDASSMLNSVFTWAPVNLMSLIWFGVAVAVILKVLGRG